MFIVTNAFMKKKCNIPEFVLVQVLLDGSTLSPVPIVDKGRDKTNECDKGKCLPRDS